MYRLSFDASSTRDNRHCHVYFGQNEDPWQTQIGKIIWLKKEKQTFTFNITLAEIYSTMRLSLEIGDGNADVRIDNVRLIKTGYDRDGDGIEDNLDNCPDIPNLVQDDADGDQIGNPCDNCLFIANPDQKNSDNDELGNACDNCPYVSNENQMNTDSDEIGNACDNCPYISNENQMDTDNDGVGNACDNCPDIANPDQSDNDNDGVGNVCENNYTVIGNNNSDKHLKIYPNPVSDVLYIKTKIESTVILYDQTGRIIRKTGIHESDIQFDVTDLQKGVYILRIENKLGNSVKKILIQ
jgi:hypothetical protein